MSLLLSLFRIKCKIQLLGHPIRHEGDRLGIMIDVFKKIFSVFVFTILFLLNIIMRNLVNI